MITAAYFIVTLLLATALYFGIRWLVSSNSRYRAALNLDVIPVNVQSAACWHSHGVAIDRGGKALLRAPAARLRHVISNLRSKSG